MVKRKYVEPKLSRVKLNPEQAVLSQCSATSTTIKDRATSGQCADAGCKQKANGGAATASS